MIDKLTNGADRMAVYLPLSKTKKTGDSLT